MFLSLQFLLNNIIFTYKKKSNLLYKCISKFLANRLHGCLNETINYDIVKGMSIFESISSYLLMSWWGVTLENLGVAKISKIAMVLTYLQIPKT